MVDKEDLKAIQKFVDEVKGEKWEEFKNKYRIEVSRDEFIDHVRNEVFLSSLDFKDLASALVYANEKRDEPLAIHVMGAMSRVMRQGSAHVPGNWSELKSLKHLAERLMGIIDTGGDNPSSVAIATVQLFDAAIAVCGEEMKEVLKKHKLLCRDKPGHIYLDDFTVRGPEGS